MRAHHTDHQGANQRLSYWSSPRGEICSYQIGPAGSKSALIKLAPRGVNKRSSHWPPRGEASAHHIAPRRGKSAFIRMTPPRNGELAALSCLSSRALWLRSAFSSSRALLSCRDSVRARALALRASYSSRVGRLWMHTPSTTVRARRLNAHRSRTSAHVEPCGGSGDARRAMHCRATCPWQLDLSSVVRCDEPECGCIRDCGMAAQGIATARLHRTYHLECRTTGASR